MSAGTSLGLGAAAALALVGAGGRAGRGRLAPADMAFTLGVVALAGLAAVQCRTCEGPSPAGDRLGQVPELPFRVRSGVKLGPKQVAFARSLAERTGIGFRVRSGTRTAAEQAAAMLKKVELGEDLVDLYGAKALELLPLPRVVETWAAKIAELAKRGVVFSRHMVGDAFDIDYDGVTADDVEVLEGTARGMGAKAWREETPPHLHVERIPQVLVT